MHFVSLILIVFKLYILIFKIIKEKIIILFIVKIYIFII